MFIYDYIKSCEIIDYDTNKIIIFFINFLNCDRSCEKKLSSVLIFYQ